MGMSNSEAVNNVIQGYQLSKPILCPDELFTIMKTCWNEDPLNRPTMREIFDVINISWYKLKQTISTPQPQSNRLNNVEIIYNE